MAEDYQFKGPFLEARSKEAYCNSASRLATIVRGHELLRKWERDNEACPIYDVNIETPTGKGKVTMTEWHTAGTEQLHAGRIILDTAAFRALLPG